MSYIVHKGLPPPAGRPDKQNRSNKLPELIALAARMQMGDAVELTLSEANTLRTILLAQGFVCRTDGWRCQTRGKVLAFKLWA